MTSIRHKFVADFGEHTARLLEDAATDHADVYSNDATRGADPFKWVLCICIGHDCLSNDRYREYHRLGDDAPSWDVLRQWIIDHGELSSHDGSIDSLAAMCGAYDDFVK